MGATATPPTNFVQMKTGFYTGDGLDDRVIDIGVNLHVKQYKFVMVWQNGAVRPVFYCTPHSGDLGFFFDETIATANTIQGFETTGFEVGTHASVNTLDVVYKYLAIWQRVPI